MQRNGEKKLWLWQYRNCIEREKEITLRIEKIRNELAGLKAISYSGMPASGTTHDLSDGMVRLMEEEEKLLEERKKAGRTWRQIQTAITSPKLGRYQTDVLFRRYIQGMAWDDIAEEMGTSLRTVYRIHGEALEKIRPPKEK